MSSPFYSPDLAHAHDAGYFHVARGAAGVLLAELQRRGMDSAATHVVDLGCGSGVLAAELTSAGCRVTGIDVAPEMLAIAQRNAPQAQFICASLWEAEVPHCDVACSTGEPVNYYSGEPPTEADLRALFHRIHAALTPGGLLLFDSAGPGRVPPEGGKRHWRSGPYWAVLSESSEDSERGLLERRITTFRQVADSDLYRRTHEVHRLRLWDKLLIGELLAEASFSFETRSTYGDIRLPPGMGIWLAEKRP